VYSYRAPLRDIRFVVHDVLDIEDHYRAFGREELNKDLLEGILEEGARFAETVLAPTNRVGDEKGLRLEGGNVYTPPGFKEAYDRYCVPETGQIFYEGGFANFHLHPPTEVHFKNGERAPLLIVGADADHTVPAKLSKAQYKKYEHSPAQTDYLEFAGRPHLHMVADDWEEVAEAVAGWVDGVLAAPPAAMQEA